MCETPKKRWVVPPYMLESTSIMLEEDLEGASSNQGHKGFSRDRIECWACIFHIQGDINVGGVRV